MDRGLSEMEWGEIISENGGLVNGEGAARDQNLWQSLPWSITQTKSFQNCPFIYVDLNLTLLKFTRINMNFLWVPCSFPHISWIPTFIDSWKKKNKYKSFFFFNLGWFKICCQIRVSPIMEKPNTWINSAMKSKWAYSTKGSQTY